jgi:hypothetical protein
MAYSTSRRLQIFGLGALTGLLASWLLASGASAAQAQPEAELSVFPAPVTVLANKALKPHRSAALSLTAASLPSNASSLEVTVMLTAAGKAGHVTLGGSAVYAGAHQTTTTTLLIALAAGGLTVTNTGGTSHVSVLLDGYNAPSAGTAALESEVSTLKSQVATLQGQLSTVQGTVSGLQTTVSGVQSTANSLSSTFTDVTRTKDANGYPTLRFSGMNLQVVNGTGDETDVNGLGNLIVGYDDNPNSYARTGSHNLIAGDGGGWTSYGGLVAGEQNQVTNIFASVAGGFLNIASNQASSVAGGEANHASGLYSSAEGGSYNTASGQLAAISGGTGNTASGGSAAIAGGEDNFAAGGAAFAGGGNGNNAKALGSSVTGGTGNTSNGYLSWIGGGNGSLVTSDCQGVPTVPTGGCP